MRVPKDKVIYNFSQDNPPVMRVALPASLTFETHDCFAGQIKSADDTLAFLDFTKVNPATGPVYLEAVRPGDVLAIHVSDIRVFSPGIMVALPGAGLLGELVTIPETRLLNISDGHVHFGKLHLPLAPMIGVIGVAPDGDRVPCGTPGAHGGNMDTTLITAGSTLFLPVQVEGALLAMGDLHALMGDGEIMVSGVEVAGEVDVTLTKAEGWKLEHPLVITPHRVATISSAPTLDEAAEIATRQMAQLVQNWTGFTLNETGMFLSATGHLEICQAVDPLKTVRMALPRALLRQLGVAVAF
ncbi:MAG TPA: acetamidase/formamidase family protein [Spirochaetia bacterium]|nr:acetamidase/formamidase family protein [Spirochaetia bacterium]